MAGVASVAFALPKVTRAGKYLYQDSGARFYIKGVAYQQQGMHLQGQEVYVITFSFAGHLVTASNGFPEPIDYVGTSPRVELPTYN